MKLLLKYILFGGLLCISFGTNAQDLDIEAMTKDTKFRVSGGVNADAMFFNSSAENFLKSLATQFKIRFPIVKSPLF